MFSYLRNNFLLILERLPKGTFKHPPKYDSVGKKTIDIILDLRDRENIVDITTPNFSRRDYSMMSKEDIYTLKLKQELDNKNVSDLERRSLTLKSAFFNIQDIPNSLLLVDRKTVEYYNFFQSLLNIINLDDVKVSRSGGEKESRGHWGNLTPVEKAIEFNEDTLFLLSFFSMRYEKMVSSEFIIPFNYFYSKSIERLNYVTNKVFDDDLTSRYMVRRLITSYCNLFDLPLIEDYSLLDSFFQSFNNTIKLLLSNVEIKSLKR